MGSGQTRQRARVSGLYEPKSVEAKPGKGGLPVEVDGTRVENILEDWLVTDAWWSGSPVRRRYLELILEDGSNLTVFCDLNSGRWFMQRA